MCEHNFGDWGPAWLEDVNARECSKCGYLELRRSPVCTPDEPPFGSYQDLGYKGRARLLVWCADRVRHLASWEGLVSYGKANKMHLEYKDAVRGVRFPRLHRKFREKRREVVNSFVAAAYAQAGHLGREVQRIADSWDGSPEEFFNALESTRTALEQERWHLVRNHPYRTGALWCSEGELWKFDNELAGFVGTLKNV